MMMQFLRVPLVFCLSLMIGVVSLPSSANACGNAVQQIDPEVKFMESVEKKLQRGDRRRACGQVLRKFKLVAAGREGYYTVWTGRKAPQTRSRSLRGAPARPRTLDSAGAAKGFQKRMKPPVFSRSPASLLYSYCIMTEASAFKRAEKVKPEGMPLKSWATHVLSARVRVGTPITQSRYAEILMDSDPSQAKVILQRMAAAKTLPTAHAWLTWAKIMKAEGDDAATKQALKSCGRMAKKQKKKVCRL